MTQRGVVCPQGIHHSWDGKELFAVCVVVKCHFRLQFLPV